MIVHSDVKPDIDHGGKEIEEKKTSGYYDGCSRFIKCGS